MTKGHNIYKKGLDIDSTMLEVVNVHRVIWIILIFKYKLYQQINEPNHAKRLLSYIYQQPFFVLIGHLPILTGTFQHCSVSQKVALAKEQTWDVSVDIKCFI